MKPTAEVRKRYNLKHRERLLKEAAEYRDANREKIRQQQRKWYQANRAKVMDKNIKWRAENPEKHKAIVKRYSEKYKDRCAAATRAWYQENKPKSKQDAWARNLKRFYGITALDYEKMLKKQKGICPICRKQLTLKRPPVDHCHKTGKVRAILCNSCNWGLGHFKDDIPTVKRAASYLRKHSPTATA